MTPRHWTLVFAAIAAAEALGIAAAYTENGRLLLALEQAAQCMPKTEDTYTIQALQHGKIMCEVRPRREGLVRKVARKR